MSWEINRAWMRQGCYMLTKAVQCTDKYVQLRHIDFPFAVKWRSL